MTFRSGLFEKSESFTADNRRPPRPPPRPPPRAPPRPRPRPRPPRRPRPVVVSIPSVVDCRRRRRRIRKHPTLPVWDS